jgi:hypothetical protein
VYYANPNRQIPMGSYGNKDLAYYLLSERIESKFPEGANTLKQLYEGVGRKLRLPFTTFHEVVNSAVKSGYIIKI